MRGVFLVGFMGSGKTTIGKALALRMGWEFVDTDDDVAAAAGMTIPEIFEKRGEPAFRDLEHEAILRRAREVREGTRLVVALGGGAFAAQRNVDALRGCGLSVWLDAPLEVMRRRVAPASHRPLARDPVKFAALYESRREAYARADCRVEAPGDDPADAAARIAGLLS